VFGVLLVALGSVWLAANLGRLDLLETLRTYWPAALVFWGAVELLAVAVERARQREVGAPDTAGGEDK
jgi:hypothetical protein